MSNKQTENFKIKQLSLFDLWHVLVRNYYVIIIVVIISLGAAIFHTQNNYGKQQYISSAVIQSSSFYNIEEHIFYKKFMPFSKGVKNAEFLELFISNVSSSLPKAALNLRVFNDNQFMEIKASSFLSPKDSVNLLTDYRDFLKKEQQVRLENRRSGILSELSLIDSKLKNINITFNEIVTNENSIYEKLVVNEKKIYQSNRDSISKFNNKIEALEETINNLELFGIKLNESLENIEEFNLESNNRIKTNEEITLNNGIKTNEEIIHNLKSLEIDNKIKLIEKTINNLEQFGSDLNQSLESINALKQSIAVSLNSIESGFDNPVMEGMLIDYTLKIQQAEIQEIYSKIYNNNLKIQEFKLLLTELNSRRNYPFILTTERKDVKNTDIDAMNTIHKNYLTIQDLKMQLIELLSARDLVNSNLSETNFAQPVRNVLNYEWQNYMDKLKKSQLDFELKKSELEFLSNIENQTSLAMYSEIKQLSKPIQLHPVMVIFLSIVLGLGLGVALVFFINLFTSSKAINKNEK